MLLPPTRMAAVLESCDPPAGSGKWRMLKWVLLTVASLLVFGCGDERGGVSVGRVFEGDRFLNIAHRGGARLAPEHTLVAYLNGLEAGADVIEFDVHATADGVVVILHDDTVDRTTNGSGLVKEMTLAELKQLDAGYRFTRDGGQTFPWRGKGLTIPTLEEGLALLPDVPLSVEIKQRTPAIVDAVLATFAAHGNPANVVFASFPPEPMEQIRQRLPGTRTAFTSREMSEFAFLTPTSLPSYLPPSGFIQPPKELVDATFLERAHALGLKVHAWTVNDREDMCRLRQLGVDGLFTDDPVALAEVVADPACGPTL